MLVLLSKKHHKSTGKTPQKTLPGTSKVLLQHHRSTASAP
jgi:hypothetical protein